MVGMCGVNRYLSDPDMVAAQLVEQEYLQALGKVQYKKIVANLQIMVSKSISVA